MKDTTFKSGIAYISKYLGRDMSASQISMYWQMLKHLDDETYLLGVKNALMEFIPTSAAPFPLVAHILRYCGEAGGTQATNAISKLKNALKHGPYQSVSFDDPALHFVVESNGGWPVLCAWSGKEWDVNEGRLLESYKSAKLGDLRGKDHLPGIAEKSNGWFSLFVITTKDPPMQIRCRGDIPKIQFNPSGYCTNSTNKNSVDLLSDLTSKITKEQIV